MTARVRGLSIAGIVGGVPSLLVGGSTIVWLGSSDYRNPECWLGPNDGTWLTMNEVHLIAVYALGALGFVLVVICAFVLEHLNWLSGKAAFLTGVLGLSALIPIGVANALTNDGYIDRLYGACERNQGT